MTRWQPGCGRTDVRQPGVLARRSVGGREKRIGPPLLGKALETGPFVMSGHLARGDPPQTEVKRLWLRWPSDRPDRNTPSVPEPVRAGSREVLNVASAATTTHEHLRSRLIFLFVATVALVGLDACGHGRPAKSAGNREAAIAAASGLH